MQSAGAPAAVAPAGASLPDFGDSSATSLPRAEERKLGEALLQQLRDSHALLDDLEVGSYIESLGARLAAQSNLPPDSLTFFVIRDKNINAFAAPGGIIGINAGLIMASESESELAAVLAHEIAHVSQRHMARTFEAASRMQIPVAVGILAAILLGSASPQASQAALAGTVAGNIQQQINFIRGNEEEADSIGIQILSASGYDPNGMPDFFARLERIQRLYGEVVPEFLQTHPINISRIASARDRIGRLPPPRPADDTEYRLLRIKVEVLTRQTDDRLLEQLRSRIEQGESRARYGLSLALLDRGQAEAALEALAPLLRDDPDRPEYLALQARALANSGQIDRALRQYEAILAIYPGHRAVTLGYAQLLLNNRRAADAAALLEGEVRAGRISRGVHQLLSDAAFSLGRETEGRWHRAQWLLLDGREGAAREELQRALQAARGDPYQSARITAKLREIRDQPGGEAKSER